MANANPVDIEHLAELITEYLDRNPCAVDTLPGIQYWWLSGSNFDLRGNVVEKAVQILLQRGALVCRVQADGSKTYSRC